MIQTSTAPIPNNTTVKKVSLRDLKIKAGVVKRTGKELVAYGLEAEKQTKVIEALVARDADEHDVRKQKEVLDETTMILPDCKARLVVAYNELLEMMKSVGESEADEVVLAHQIIAATVPLL